jgi:flavin-dependent dehydrogenase
MKERAMREVDYLIIGAGIAGMTLRRFLDANDVALVDPRPERYKIGESIVPPHFFAPELRPLLAEARKLPSAAAKLGTLFVSDEGVSFFHAYYDAAFTIHLDRQELEALYRRCLQPEILREQVVDIDVSRRVVTTDAGAFRVRRQILDCSGPAMVMARRLGLAYELWPVHASWAYFDVTRRDDARFWEDLRAREQPFFRFDDARMDLCPSTIDEALPAGETTMLTRVADGVWTWQIPLYGSTLLSFGVVSRHGPIDEDAYREITERALGAQYHAALRPWDGSSPHNRFHRRNRFAWASREFAGPGWALVGDAAFFGDPVYSVGTGIATNQAIRLASLLRRYPWEDGGFAIYDRKTREIFERARAAYGHWYAGEVTREGEVARTIQADFLNGLAFHHRTGELYLDMCALASTEDESDPRYGNDPGEDLTPLVPSELKTSGGWTAERSISRNGALEIAWRHPDSPALTMVIASRLDAGKAYRHAGPFALSYRRSPDGSSDLDANGRHLFETFADALIRHQTAMTRLLEARPGPGGAGAVARTGEEP